MTRTNIDYGPVSSYSLAPAAAHQDLYCSADSCYVWYHLPRSSPFYLRCCLSLHDHVLNVTGGLPRCGAALVVTGSTHASIISLCSSYELDDYPSEPMIPNQKIKFNNSCRFSATPVDSCSVVTSFTLPAWTKREHFLFTPLLHQYIFILTGRLPYVSWVFSELMVHL
ncbi:hypothetical protein SISSUDRAFT_1038944 [Sistotremastrum suecicum HHB10207 ss-3]|uniref:Uncharacterized protein n=1 Tax=Sistotremastrum suecicum HHB10207 ss-3 TaxID=1314776 RepID=A0A166J6U3_9AGAM|nr:hypothetical protein SISSUDRAFT_1038944 [Sistotremastrum suecicum HHB10207 ss-3]